MCELSAQIMLTYQEQTIVLGLLRVCPNVLSVWTLLLLCKLSLICIHVMYQMCFIYCICGIIAESNIFGGLLTKYYYQDFKLAALSTVWRETIVQQSL